MTNQAQRSKELLRDLNVSVSVLAECFGTTTHTIDRWARSGVIPRASLLLLTGINQWMEDLWTHEHLPGKFTGLKHRKVCNDTFRELFKETYG